MAKDIDLGIEGCRVSAAAFLSLEICSNRSFEARCASEVLDVFPKTNQATFFEVLVPGWLWALGDRNSSELLIRFFSSSASIDGDSKAAWEVRITSELLRQRFSEITEASWNELCDQTVVGALEHLHYGPIALSELTEEEQSWFQGAAKTCGLQELFPKAPCTGVAEVRESALKKFGSVLDGKVSETEALLDALYSAWPVALEHGEELAFVLSVTPAFCDAGGMLELRNALDLLEFPSGCLVGGAWTWSAAMPHLLVDCKWAEVSRLAIEISKADTKEWVAHAALSWCVFYVFSPDGYRVPIWLREQLASNVMAYIKNRAALNEGPGANRHMREAMLLLVDKAELLSQRTRDEVPWTALQAFGTSPEFWEEIDVRLAQGKLSLEGLAAGASAFSMLRHVLDGKMPLGHREELVVDAALRDLSMLGVARLETFRTEALGSYGTGRSRRPDYDAIQRLGREASERVLRGAFDPIAPDLIPMPVGALENGLSADVALAEVTDMASTIKGMMKRAQALLCEPENDRYMAELAPFLAHTSDGNSDFAGIGAAVALISDFAGMGALHRALELCRVACVNLDALTKNDRAALSGSVFLIGAMRRLREAGLEGEPDFDALLRRLPDHPHWAARARQKASGVSPAPALFDTVVMVCSCHENLSNRVEAQRSGWLSELKNLGIPYVVLVGGEKTELIGDVLQVEAADSYEGLPEKILKGFEWLRDNTDASHILKIDDDCHLDVQTYFFSARWRCASWYGRILRKDGALTDRLWHQSRAISPRGKLAFDRAPRSRLYTDGGTGYALDRRALWALHGAACTLEGQRVIAGTYSEDVCVGALLCMEGLSPDERDYHTMVLRHGRQGEPAVLKWSEGMGVNDHFGFTRVMHMDGTLNLRTLEAERKTTGLFPKRIWPAEYKATFKDNNGSLTYLGSTKHLRNAMDVPVAVACVLRNERVMLPHFLAHYRQQGVQAFLFADNLSDDGSLEYLLKQSDCAVFSAAAQFNSVDQGTAWKRALISQFRMGKWTLVADVDEFLMLPEGVDTLETYLDDLPAGVDAQRVKMLDMYPGYDLSKADFETTEPFYAAPFHDKHPYLSTSLSKGPFGNERTLTSALRHRLLPGARVDSFVACKTALLRYKPWMRLSTSFHFATGVSPAEKALVFAHFKFHAQFHNKAEIEVQRGQYWNDSEEYRAYLSGEISGRTLMEEGMSVRVAPPNYAAMQE